MVIGRRSPEHSDGFRRDQEDPESDAELGTEFEAWAVADRDLERQHPLGPETDSIEVKTRRQETARGLLQRLREHPFSKPLFRFMTLLVGVGGIGYGGIKEMSRELGEDVPQVEGALEDPGVRYELKKILFEELLDRGQVFDELEARNGREAWSQEEKIDYQQIPDLEDKFEFLHKDHPELVATYAHPHKRMESYKGILNLMTEEFRHSSLPFEFTKSCIDSSAEVFVQMEQQAARDLYVQFSHDLMKSMGVRSVRNLAEQLAKGLPADHLVNQQVQADGWLGEEVGTWLEPSKENSLIFDQAAGEVRAFHHRGGKKILLDVFPGNGGPTDGVAWERGMPGHVAVRTPDGNFTFDRVLEKKSPSWQFSWVADTAELRFTDDKKEVDYKDQDGTWRRLTGEDAEFVVYGAPQKPFQQKMASRLYKTASKQETDGSWQRPVPFSVEDALGEEGQLRKAWDLNDFGPRTIRMRDGQGELMSVFFHSSPGDESPNAFLDYSHGCIHMKPGDLDLISTYLERGSGIRISSFDEIVASAQFERPGTLSEPRG